MKMHFLPQNALSKSFDKLRRNGNRLISSVAHSKGHLNLPNPLTALWNERNQLVQSFAKAILTAVLLFSVNAFAETAEDEWQNTVLTETTIKKIQASKYDYKKCIGENMQKPAFLDMDSRKATEEIIKQCEPVLSKVREVYLAQKVPGVLADRHLRQIRIQTTRNALQGMIFAQAARKAGQP